MQTFSCDVSLNGRIISADVSLITAGIGEAPNDGKTYGRNSKEWVEVESGGGGTWGGITGDIQDQTDLITELNLKVDKVTGKGLSTNDYTDADKNRLADTSGENTGDQDLSGLAIDNEVFHNNKPAEISNLTEKNELADLDEVLLEDSENSFNKVKTTLLNIRDFFKATYDAAYDLVYAKLSGGNTFMGEQSILEGLKIAKIYPNADGIAAIQICKADKTTQVLYVDTTNGRIGIGVAPGSYGLNVSGSIYSLLSMYSQVGFQGAKNGVVYYGNSDGGVASATVLQSKNIEFLRGLPDQSMNCPTGKYHYMATSPTADTVNDVRFYNNSGTLTFQKCTVANASKGGGTWVNIGTM